MVSTPVLPSAFDPLHVVPPTFPPAARMPLFIAHTAIVPLSLPLDVGVSPLLPAFSPVSSSPPVASSSRVPMNNNRGYTRVVTMSDFEYDDRPPYPGSERGKTPLPSKDKGKGRARQSVKAKRQASPSPPASPLGRTVAVFDESHLMQTSSPPPNSPSPDSPPPDLTWAGQPNYQAPPFPPSSARAGQPNHYPHQWQPHQVSSFAPPGAGYPHFGRPYGHPLPSFIPPTATYYYADHSYNPVGAGHYYLDRPYNGISSFTPPPGGYYDHRIPPSGARSYYADRVYDPRTLPFAPPGSAQAGQSVYDGARQSLPGRNPGTPPNGQGSRAPEQTYEEISYDEVQTEALRVTQRELEEAGREVAEGLNLPATEPEHRGVGLSPSWDYFRQC